MTDSSRRRLIKAGLAAATGVAGIGAAAGLARHYGILPPDAGGALGAGEALNYASYRLLTADSLAREFPQSEISAKPVANEIPAPSEEFRRLEAAGFVDWRLSIEGMVDRPGALSLAELKSFPVRSQITQLACEEGWSYVAEWTGVLLRDVLERAGIQARARYVAYFSIDPDWWDSIDMGDALHPQTLLTYGMNGGDLPVGNGGPLRMRVPRQLGYKSVKFIRRLVVTDDLSHFGKGLGSASPEGGYAWYAGI
jgi:DMSO/TMAO reductase YedYZ molybdopterin-dependent catalytic subunit